MNTQVFLIAYIYPKPQYHYNQVQYCILYIVYPPAIKKTPENTKNKKGKSTPPKQSPSQKHLASIISV